MVVDLCKFLSYNEITITAKRSKNAKEVICVDKEKLLKTIDKQVFNRQDILAAASMTQAGFRETQLRNLMHSLLQGEDIIRVGRNRYVLSDENNAPLKREYRPQYSDGASELRDQMEHAFPYLDYQIWELRWLNEFTNHLVGSNVILLEVPKDAGGYVYSTIARNYAGPILLQPSQKELDYYGGSNGAIIGGLISESPSLQDDPHTPALEKIIVDLFANRILRMMLSQGDYPFLLDAVFTKYRVNQTRLFRYARRRNKEDEIRQFIVNNTEILLLDK